MSARTLEINGRKVSVLEDGSGDPTLYLHGFADVHGGHRKLDVVPREAH